MYGAEFLSKNPLQLVGMTMGISFTPWSYFWPVSCIRTSEAHVGTVSSTV